MKNFENWSEGKLADPDAQPLAGSGRPYSPLAAIPCQPAAEQVAPVSAIHAASHGRLPALKAGAGLAGGSVPAAYRGDRPGRPVNP